MPARVFLIWWLWAAAAASCLWGQGGPPGATVSQLLTFEGNEALVYAASNRGVFMSNDGGVTWSARSMGLSVGLVRAIAGAPGRLFAATIGGGIFRSSDGGASWQEANNGLTNLNVASLAIDPQNHNVIYAGTVIDSEMPGRIFKSTDGGESWAPAGQGVPNSNYVEIAVSPADSNRIVAAGRTSLSPPAGGLIRSRDGGAQWEVIASASLAFFHVSFDPQEPNVIHIGTSLGYLRSDDGGDSFVAPSNQSFVLNDLAFDPNDANRLFGATFGSGLILSPDRGESWFVAGEGFPSLTQYRTIATLSAESPRLLAGGAGPGVFRSDDLGESWRLSSSGMSIADVPAIAVHADTAGQALAAVFGGMLFRTENGGQAWRESRQGLSTAGLSELLHQPNDAAVVYGGSINPTDSFDGALFRSQDSGQSWETRATGIPVFGLAHHPSDGRTLYIATRNALLRTSDGGDSFQDVGPGCDPFLAPCRIADVAVDPSNPNNLFAILVQESFAADSYQFIFSDDGGDDWEGAGATGIPLLRITVDPTNPERIFVAGAGIFRSQNRGRQFLRLRGGLPDDGVVRVESVAVDANDSGALYAATSAGVFRSNDQGENWMAANDGLGFLLAQVLRVDPRNAGVVYAGTFEGGVYKTSDGGQSWFPTGGVPAFTARGVVGALDFQGGGVAPGELVSVFGASMGPFEGVLTAFEPETGKLPTTVSGVTVFFGEEPAPVIFLRGDQINLQVPFEVAGLQSVEMRIVVAGVETERVSVAVLASHPGVHPNVLNQDSTLNSAENPERPGRVIQIFVSGQGLIDPPLMSGEPAPGMLPVPEPQLPVEVSVGGASAEVLFRGMAPGFAGLLQVNARADRTLPAGAHDIAVTIGGRRSQSAARVFLTRESLLSGAPAE